MSLSKAGQLCLFIPDSNADVSIMKFMMNHLRIMNTLFIGCL